MDTMIKIGEKKINAKKEMQKSRNRFKKYLYIRIYLKSYPPETSITLPLTKGLLIQNLTASAFLRNT